MRRKQANDRRAERHCKNDCDKGAFAADAISPPTEHNSAKRPHDKRNREQTIDRHEACGREKLLANDPCE